MNKLKEIINGFRNDGTDPRKNDAWRILLFSLNAISGVAVMQLIYKWSYYTQNVLQLGVFLSSMVLPMTLLDAVTDPLIANWFDRFESKHGKFRPFMLMGGLMSFIPMLVIYCYPVDSGLPLKATYAILTGCYALIIIGNTIVMTVTRAGQAIITQDPAQRPLYSLGHTVFDAIIAGFVSIMLTSNIIGDMQDPRIWNITSIVLAALSLVLMFVAMYAVKNRDNPQYYSITKADEKPKITEFFKLVKRSKPLRSLLWASGSDVLAASVRGTLVIYLFANILMHRSLSAMFDILCSAVMGAIMLLIGIYLASKKGSAFVYTKISVIQIILSGAGFVYALIFFPANPDYEYTGLNLKVIILLLIFGSYIGTLGVSTNLVNALTGDLADYEYSVSGKFIPGTIGSTLTFVTKIIGSLVGVITMGIMMFCGFGKAGEASVVPENVFVNTRFHYCILLAVFVLPCIGHIITYISMRKYPLTLEKMNEVSYKIAQDRGVIKEKAE